MPRIWLYARVSKDEATVECCGKPHKIPFGKAGECDRCKREILNNAQPHRIASQLTDCHRLADYEAIPGDRVELWEVTSASAAPLSKREHGRNLLTMTQRGDHVICTKMDRLFRNLRDMVNTMEAFERRGVTVHLVEQKIDTSNAMGRLMMQVIAMFAEFEASIQGERRRERARQLKAEGRSAGENPFGTRSDKRRDETGRIIPVIVPNETEEKLLHQLRLWHNDRRSAPWMHATLAKLDWKSRRGSHYSLTQVRRLIKRAMQTRQPGLILSTGAAE